MSRSATGRPGIRRRGAFLAAIVFGLALAAIVFGLAFEARAATGPEVVLEPQEIPLGGEARLTLTVPDGGASPELPDVPGVAIDPLGRSSEITVVNGRVSQRTRIHYAVRPSRTGEFPIDVPGATSSPGSPLSNGALVLRVVPPTAPPRAAAPSASGAGAGAAPAALAPRLELALASPDLYVGQQEPVSIRLLLPAGVTLAELAPPVISAPGFTVSPLRDAEPEESRIEVDGVPTTVLTWLASVSPVKPGAPSLEATIDGVALVREPGRPRRHGLGALLDDESFFGGGSLFDSFFGGRRRALHLSSGATPIRVEALPEADQPPDFGGAVGDFTFSSQADARGTAGDPLQATFEVAGRGNFDRVTLPGVASDAAWKAYPPSARFEPGSAEYAGRKRFTQTLIPQRAGEALVPAQRFSYFDPYARRYRTLSSEAIPVAVAPGAAPVASPGTLAAAEDGQASHASAGSSSAPVALPGGLAFRRDVEPLRTSIRPLFLAPAAHAVAAGAVGLLGAAVIVAGVRRRRNDPSRVRAAETERAVRENLRALEAAASRADAPAFFSAARGALQARLGAILGRAPETITAADVTAALCGDAERAARVRAVLEESDAFAYAGPAARAVALDAARERVRSALALLPLATPRPTVAKEVSA